MEREIWKIFIVWFFPFNIVWNGRYLITITIQFFSRICQERYKKLITDWIWRHASGIGLFGRCQINWRWCQDEEKEMQIFLLTSCKYGDVVNPWGEHLDQESSENWEWRKLYNEELHSLYRSPKYSQGD